MRSGVIVLLGLLSTAGAFAGDVTNQMLLDAQGDSESWLTYGRNYSGWRYRRVG